MKALFIVFTIFLISAGYAQTDSLNIFWQPNAEPDMEKYIIQRSVNSLQDFSEYLNVAHPDTHAVDHDVQPGNLYHYRMVAVNSVGNYSDYSDTVSAGLPGITGHSFTLNSGEMSILSLAEVATDGDNSVSELSFSFSALQNVQVTQNGNILEVTPQPLDFTGQASFNLLVTDPVGFWDERNIIINFGKGTSFTINVPDFEFPEDEFFEILVDTVFQNSDAPAEEIEWSFSQPQYLDLNFNSDSRILRVSGKVPNWFGSDQFLVTAQNSSGAASSDTVQVTVLPVNDPPELSLTGLYFNSSETEWMVDLSKYVTDIDHQVADLQFEFLQFQNFDFKFINSSYIVQVYKTGTSDSETGTVRVTDPDNGMDEKQVTVKIVSQNTPPQIVNIKSLLMAEDSVLVLNLNNFAVDSTDNPQDLIWSIPSNNHLSVKYDSENQTAEIQPAKDWHGATSLTFSVQDVAGASAQKDIPVEVEPRVDVMQMQLSNISANSAILVWQTDIPSVFTFEFWLNPFTKQTISGQSYANSHQVELQQIQPDSSYHFRLTLQDTADMILILDSVLTVKNTEALAGKVVVYPNPVKPGSGHENLYFENLPSGAQNLTIYNIFGEELYSTLIEGEQGNRLTIPLEGDIVFRIGSGYYIYMIRDDSNQVINRGKLVFIH